MDIEQEEMNDMMPLESNDLQLTDSMAESGRKILAKQFEVLISHEAESRAGMDAETIHAMRVASRRMRSALRLLKIYYKRKLVIRFSDSLQVIANSLGRVRDLDVMIDDLQVFQAKQSPDEQNATQGLLNRLAKRRQKALVNLNNHFDSPAYAKFVKSFTEFVESDKKGAVSYDADETPYQVRHVLPVLLHDCLAKVRAYETVIETIEDETLHSLRIEFKRLRYAVEFFEPILGTSASAFIESVKEMQDSLGRMNDLAVFEDRIKHIKKLSDEETAARDAYIAYLRSESAAEREQLIEKWTSFNKRTVQRQFSDALLVLR